MTDWNNKEEVLKKLEYQGYYLEYASEELQADKEVVMAAVKKNGYALQYASKELQADKKVVLAAVKKNNYGFTYADDSLRNDPVFMKEVEQYLPDWNNKEEVLEAVEEDGRNLEYASKELKGDKEVVLAAVDTSGSSLEYASKELKGDKEVVLAAVEEHYYALDFVSEDLLADKEFFITLLNIDLDYEEILYHASEKLRADREVVLAAVKDSGYALVYASEELKNDPEFMKEVEQYL